MNFQTIYDYSPYPFRVLAASFRGYVYRFQRYGINIESMVSEVLERDSWNEDQWKCWQEIKLEKLLNNAATKVPFYRKIWDKKRRQGDRSSWNYLENWPILKKENIRKDPKEFLVEDRKIWLLNEEHTSGTSGTPLTLWRSNKTDRTWYAQYEARVRRWNNISFQDRWAILGGRMITPVHQSSPPFWVWNAGLNQLYLSSYHISKENVPYYIQSIINHKVVYLLGYPSSIYTLALNALELELSIPRLKLVISNAEMLLPNQKKIIQKAFNCRIINTYGMSEIVAAGSECSKGTLHQWPDTGIVEILHNKSTHQVNIRESGRLICTGLINEEMPLIRYEIGDWATRIPSKKCACGRTLPELHNIEGRLDDILITPDGRSIGRIDPIFKADLPIKEAQIIQEQIDNICVKVVPDDSYDSKTQQMITELIRKRLGDVNVKIEEVAFIPKEINGKFKSVISKIRH